MRDHTEKGKQALHCNTSNDTFSLIFEPGTWHFYFAPAPDNYVAGLEAERAWKTYGGM